MPNIGWNIYISDNCDTVIGRRGGKVLTTLTRIGDTELWTTKRVRDELPNRLRIVILQEEEYYNINTDTLQVKANNLWHFKEMLNKSKDDDLTDIQSDKLNVILHELSEELVTLLDHYQE